MSSVPKERIPSRAWIVLLLGGVAGMLFYVDRQTLSVLKTTLKSAMGWSDIDYGWLVSAFMLAYTLGYLLSGRLIDRNGTRRMMPVFVGAMSLSTIICGLASNYSEMVVGRALLGAAEAGVVPAVLVAVFTWFPPTRRGTASTINEPINIAGQVIATPLAVAFTAYLSWRCAFLVPGVVGLMVAVAWWYADKEPEAQRLERRAPENYATIVRRREIWGVIAARMISDPAWFFLLYWEPGFLQERVGLSMEELGRIGWIPTAVATGSLVLLGGFSDRLIGRRGWTPAISRRTILQWLALTAPAVAVLPFVRSHLLAIALLCVARTMMIVWLSFSNLLMADLVPKGSIGSSVALMSAFGSAVALLCNTLVGPAIGALGYEVVFAVCACLHPIAAVILWLSYRRSPSAEAGRSRGPFERFKAKSVSAGLLEG